MARNYAKAVRWYAKAAEQGDAEAQYNLGLMYKKGQAWRGTTPRPSVVRQGRRPGQREPNSISGLCITKAEAWRRTISSLYVNIAAVGSSDVASKALDSPKKKMIPEQISKPGP